MIDPLNKFIKSDCQFSDRIVMTVDKNSIFQVAGTKILSLYNNFIDWRKSSFAENIANKKRQHKRDTVDIEHNPEQRLQKCIVRCWIFNNLQSIVLIVIKDQPAVICQKIFAGNILGHHFAERGCKNLRETVFFIG